ncbi:MAG: thioredoxin domain-containing protein [Parachlamydiaceae bacterium]|nr:thioredoxin domain-containing protein [Parachlamydiaceae bacterium]
MNTQSTTFFLEKIQARAYRYCFFLVLVALVTGLVLTVLSWMEVCVEHCSANQEYRIFGIPFAIFGLLFFPTLVLMHLLSAKYLYLRPLVSWMISSAIGAEIMFILVQKNQIGHWCPVCLSIATSLGIAGLILLASYLLKFFFNKFNKQNGGQMNLFKHAIITFSFILLGFVSAYVGISKVDAAQTNFKEMKDKLAFGNKNSQIEIYTFSDWYCPSCKKVEPIVEKQYQKLKGEATFYFVDYPIHKKSLNYTPYNLAFQVHNKSQYLQARQMLAGLAEKDENPTDEEVLKLSEKNKIPFQELSFIDVKNGMDFFEMLVQKYNLNSTPTIIITNKNGSKVIKLEGRDEISEKSILDGIKKLNNKS